MFSFYLYIMKLDIFLLFKETHFVLVLYSVFVKLIAQLSNMSKALKACYCSTLFHLTFSISWPKIFFVTLLLGPRIFRIFSSLRLLYFHFLALCMYFSQLQLSKNEYDRLALPDVGYVSPIELVAGYEPPKSCSMHILEDLPKVLDNVSCLEFIVAESAKIAQSRLQFLPTSIPVLDMNEAIAIASYTYDLGMKSSDPEGCDNLFYGLNLILRERMGPKMQVLKPYLTYLIRGLSKLPVVEELVYRGVPSCNLATVRDKYRKGVHVHWSAFTSTSTDIARAKRFAQGPGGIIFRINAVQGRRIAAYSAMPYEDEVSRRRDSQIDFQLSMHMHELKLRVPESAHTS